MASVVEPPLLAGGPLAGNPAITADETAPAFIQVIGLSALATREQVQHLFGLAGTITSLECFWLEEEAEGTPGTLIAFIRCTSPPLRSTTPPAHCTPTASFNVYRFHSMSCLPLIFIPVEQLCQRGHVCLRWRHTHTRTHTLSTVSPTDRRHSFISHTTVMRTRMTPRSPCTCTTRSSWIGKGSLLLLACILVDTMNPHTAPNPIAILC